MRAKKKSLVLILACQLCIGIFATVGFAATTYRIADFNDGSASYANALAAYNAASSGDTIIFPGGKATWQSTLEIKKPLIIDGAGTILTASGSSMSNGFFHVTGFESSTLMRITGFLFDLDSGAGTAMTVSNGISLEKLRIEDHLQISWSKEREKQLDLNRMDIR